MGCIITLLGARLTRARVCVGQTVLLPKKGVPIFKPRNPDDTSSCIVRNMNATQELPAYSTEQLAELPRGDLTIVIHITLPDALSDSTEAMFRDIIE